MDFPVSAAAELSRIHGKFISGNIELVRSGSRCRVHARGDVDLVIAIHMTTRFVVVTFAARAIFGVALGLAAKWLAGRWQPQPMAAT